MKCYIWSCFLIPIFFPLFDTSGPTWAHVHISKKWMMQSGIVQSQRPTVTRAGSRCFPRPLTPSRQQHLMRHLIILKWLFPAGGAPCSGFYDQMSSTFTGQLLHQLRSESTFFWSALEEMFVLMMWISTFSLRSLRCSTEQACTVLLICNANHPSLN